MPGCAISQTPLSCRQFLLRKPIGSSRVGALKLWVMFSLQDLYYQC